MFCFYDTIAGYATTVSLASSATTNSSCRLLSARRADGRMLEGAVGYASWQASSKHHVIYSWCSCGEGDEGVGPEMLRLLYRLPLDHARFSTLSTQSLHAAELFPSHKPGSRYDTRYKRRSYCALDGTTKCFFSVWLLGCRSLNW